jgi:hypothetical protein
MNPDPPKPKQGSFDMNTFWNPPSGNASTNNANKFDAFSNFFPTSK